MRSDRVLSLHRKEVCFETSFSLAVFSKTTNAEFAEQGPRSAGGVSTTARNESLVLRLKWLRDFQSFSGSHERGQGFVQFNSGSLTHISLSRLWLCPHIQRFEGRFVE